ncbi:Histidine kinase [Sulfidibacter corallicola]|uniref:histidine kinase n=1 Tax=Sulfidibacter corallicola TaxID=2818388 RepID=A0A8A4TK54_SULCO|nr:ATP-binding protein [Sulfidibacter corallicola]QTD49522.1 response regulator [Sulfidibacter corallicola]
MKPWHLSLPQKYFLVSFAAIFLACSLLLPITQSKKDEDFSMRELDRLHREILPSGERLVSNIEVLRKDTFVIAESPAILAWSEAKKDPDSPPKKSTEDLEKLITGVFLTFAKHNPHYRQISLYRIDQNGQEAVIVARRAGKPIRVEPTMPRLESHEKSYDLTQALSNQQTYLSEFALHRERGEIKMPRTPTLQATRPIFNASGHMVGALSIKMEFGALFDEIRSHVPEGMEFYVTNDVGDYLVSANPTEEFGFDLGQRKLIQERFPEMAWVFQSGKTKDELTFTRSHERKETAVYFHKFRFDPDSRERFLGVAIASERDRAIITWDRSMNEALIWGFILALVLGILAYVLHRRDFHPFYQLCEAMEDAPNGQLDLRGLCARKDEWGQLSKVVQGMADDHRAASQSIRKNGEDIRAILETAPDGIIWVDGNGEILMFNRAAETMFGYPSGEVLGRNISMVIGAPYVPKQISTMGDLDAENHRNHDPRQETVGKRRNGDPFPIHLTVGTSRLGEEESFTYIVRDISETKSLERKLLRSYEELDQQNQQNRALSELFELTQGNRSLPDLAGEILAFFADKFEAQIGALYGLDAADYPSLIKVYAGGFHVHTESHDYGMGLLERVIHEKKPTLVDNLPANFFPIGTGVGEAPPNQLLIFPIFERKNLVGLLELGTLNAFEDRHLSFLERVSTHLGISLSSAQNREQKKQLFKETQTQAAQLAQRQEELESAYSALEKQAAQMRQSEEDLLEKNRLLKARKADIEQTNRELERVNNFKSEFLANMSHELRTPLNSLLILSELLLENRVENLTKDQLESLSVIRSSGKDLLLLINDILDFAKIDAGKMKIAKSSLLLRESINDLIQTLVPQAEKKGLPIHVTFGDPIPNTLYSDGQRLNQILRNLLSNAIKFTEKGNIRVHTTCIQPGEEMLDGQIAPTHLVEISVTDTGIGIPKTHRESIFEAFRQLDASTSRNFEGTGLGLAISRKLAKLLGGEILLDSEEGKGSRFSVYLPCLHSPQSSTAEPPAFRPESPLRVGDGLARIASGSFGPDGTSVNLNGASLKDSMEHREGPGFHPSAAIPHPPGSPAPEPASGPEKESDQATPFGNGIDNVTALLVDDDLRNTFSLSKVLKDKGLQVLIADNGKLALEKLKERRDIDIVLMDIRMPVMDGFETMAHIRADEETKRLPVIALTAQALKGDREKCLEKGADDYLSKPLDVDLLLERIRALMNRKSPGSSTPIEQPSLESA